MLAGFVAGVTACGGEKSEEKQEAASTEEPSAEMVEHIETRQKIFDDEIKEDMKALGTMVKTGSIDAKKAAEHAASMQTSFEKLGPHFPEGSHTGATDAKVEIWEKSEDFNNASKKMGEALEALKSAGESGAANQEIAMKIKEVGDSCKACHEDFRKPKEESYKK